MSKGRVEITIQGRVQGVFYRQSTKETAIRLGLTGWVRNNPDGSVTAVFEGETPAIKEAVKWCEHGPSAARVTGVTTRWQNFEGEFSSFGILR